MPTEIKRPIIFLGAGGSGTTVIHRAIAYHPELAWLNRPAAVFFPRRPAAMRLALRALDLPLAGKAIEPWLRPSECYEFWNRSFAGFARPIRDLVAADLTERTRARLHRAFAQVPTARRSRLAIKVTGWPRLGFLKALFPDALLIHVVRDGRAQVNTMLEKDFWWGWRGPENWRFGPLSPEQDRLWHKHDRSFVALAAINWNLLLDAFERTRSQIPETDLMEVRYEDFASDPAGITRQIADFAGLTWSSRFARSVESVQIREKTSWSSDLTSQQQDTMTACLSPYHMERYGYWESSLAAPQQVAAGGL